MRPRSSHYLRGPACDLGDIIKHGFFYQVRLLISTGMDLEPRDEFRRTPLVLCAFLEPEDWGVGIARTLIESGVRIGHRDSFGRNVLHYACIHERKGLVKVLLKAIDFDLNQPDKLDNTALHYAALSGNASIVQLLTHCFKRYKINPHRINKRGKTAYQEAVEAGNHACALAIEQGLSGKRPGSGIKDVRFAVNLAVRYGEAAPSSRGSSPPERRKQLRPMTAAVFSRRDSTSSSNSLDDTRSPVSFRSRSNLSWHFSNPHNKKSQQALYALGYKRDEDVIRCIPDTDIRNNPYYVFKMVHLPYEPEDWDQCFALDSTNRNRMWGENSSTSPSQQVPVEQGNWRQELKMLFKVYENQCSSSWRAAVKNESPRSEFLDQQSSTGQDDEEEKGRKPRRHTSASKHGRESASEASMKRRQSISRIRRMPSVPAFSKHGSGTSADGTLDTSSESTNSLSSSKKRGVDSGGVTKETALGRPENSTPRSSLRQLGDQPPPRSPSPSTISPKSSSAATARHSNNNSPELLLLPTLKQKAMTEGPTRTTAKTISEWSGKKLPASRDSWQPNSAASGSRVVPKVNEILVSDSGPQTLNHIPHVDVNKLWVQSPYDDDEDEDDEELSED